MKPEMSTAVMIERLRALIPDSQDGSLLNQVANRIELLLEAESGMSREMACIRHALDIPPDQSVQSGVVDAFVRLNGEILELRNRLVAYDRAAKEPVYQYQSGICNDENGETDWYWDDCDKGFYDQYAADRRRILYAAPPLPVVPQTLLRELVDVVWQDAKESTEVPSTEWADELIGRVFPAAQTLPVVPDEVTEFTKPNSSYEWRKGYNACRAAMLQSGNPVWIGIDWAKGCGPTPALEGWALVPVTADSEMMAAAIACGVTRGTDGALYVKYDDIYAAMIAAAPQLERKDGDA
ncbi:hypothetical protein [Pectobacterium aroidearum]|uniref:hypothetical protein n=1 Tax=Pectobacterium aroidearum TaxID=1201031 RepID=UPI00301714DA